MARLHYLLVLAAFCVLGFATYFATNSSQQVYAATSSTLNFQGRLLNSSGSIVPDGYYNIEFKLYDGGTDGGPGGTGEANAGTNLWTETYYDSNGVTAGNDNRVRVVNGYFSVNLGSQTAFGGSINWDQELWLTMNVGGSTQTATPTWDGEMLATGSKRTKLTGVPYAFRAGAVMGANGAYDADDLVQLAPGSVQAVNSANTAIRVNQQGAGNLLQLQSSAADRFVIENDGDLVAAGDGTYQGGDLIVGTASVAGDLTLYDGSSNTGILAVAALGQNTVYTLPDPGDGSDTICLQELANCAGTGDIVQNGNSFGTAITIGSNDDYGLNFETNGTTKFSLSNTGAALFQNGTNSTTAFQIQTSAAANVLTADTTNNRLLIGASAATTGASEAVTLRTGNGYGFIQTNGTQVFGTAITAYSGQLGTYSNTQLEFFTNNNTGAPAQIISNTGATTFKNNTDSTTAFQIQNAAGAQLINVDTTTSNLISNGSIEVNATGWAAEGGSSVARATSQAYYGNASLDVATTAANHGAKFNVSLASSTTYYLRMMVKSSVSFTGTFDIGYSGDGSTLTNCSTGNSPNTSSWKYYNCSFTTGTTSGTTFIFARQTDATARSIYIDAVQLVTGAQAPYREGAISLNGVITSPVILQNQSNSAFAFNIQNAAGTVNTLTVDTAQTRIGIATSLPDNTFQIGTGNTATLSSNTGYQTIGVTSSTNLVLDTSQIQARNNGAAGTLEINKNGGTLAVGGTTANTINFNNGQQTLSDTGAALFRNGANSTAAFSIQNADASRTLFSVDTTNNRVGIGTASPGAALEISDGTDGTRFGLLANGGINIHTSNSAGDITINPGGDIGIGTALSDSITLGRTDQNITTTINGSVLAKAQTDSATSFQIQNAAGTQTLFTADTSNNRIYIGNTTGDTTGTVLVLDDKTDGTDPTGVNGSMYYNSSLGKFRCYEGGAWKDCDTDTASSVDLQTAYDNGAAGDQVIELDSTNDSIIIRNPSSGGSNGTGYALTIDQLATGGMGGLDIQSAGTGNLLKITDTTATARDVLTIADGGATTFRNQTDSSAAFRIQNAAGTGVLTADTTNQRINIGTIGTETGQFYVAGRIPTATTGSVATGTQPRSVVVQGRYAYVTSYADDTFEVYDVSNPASPVMVNFAAAGNGPYGLSVQGRYAYVANLLDDNIQVFDISNPNAPTSVDTIAAGNDPISIYVQGRYAYVVSSSDDTLRLFDVSNPTNVVAAGTLAIGDNPQSVYVQGRYAYVTNYTGGTLQVIDISNPASPSSVGSVATGTNPTMVTVSGSYAYVTNYGSNTMQVFNVRNPASPSSVGSVATGNGPQALYVQGRYAYVVNATTGLETIDISNPASPTAEGAVATGTAPQSVYVQGRYAYVVNYTSSNLQIFDVGGAYIQQLEAGGIQTDTLSVTNNADFFNDVSIGGGLQVSGGAQINGNFGASGQVLFQNASNSATALQVQNAAGTSILNVNTSTGLVTLSGGADATLAGATTGQLVLGSTSSTNIAYDDNEIQARNNGSAGNLYINPDGGGLYVGASTSNYINFNNGKAIFDTDGYVTLQNSTNAATALQILQSDGSTRVSVDTQDGAGLKVYANASDEIFEISNATGLQVRTAGTTAWTNLGTSADGTNILNLYNSGGTTVGSVSGTGATLFKNSTNSTTAFQIQNAAGTSLLTADTSNSRINILGDVNLGSRFGNRLFSDSFESGTLDLWSGGTGGTAAPTISQTQSRDGKYATEVDLSSDSGYVSHWFGNNGTTVYARAWAYVSSQTSASVGILSLEDVDAGDFWDISRNTSNQICLDSDTGGAEGCWGGFTEDAWHLIEVRITSDTTTTGTSQVWIDGSQVYNASNDNNGTSQQIDSIYLGDGTGGLTATYYIDSVSVDTSSAGSANTSTSLSVDDSLHVGGTATFGGNVMIQPITATTNMFQIRDSAGYTYLNVDGDNLTTTLGTNYLDLGGPTSTETQIAISTGGTNRFFLGVNSASPAGANGFYLYNAQQNDYVLSVGATNGNAIFRNSNDSASGFQVQDASGDQLFNLDSTNGRIEIGDYGTPTGQLYIGGITPTAAIGSIGTGGGLSGGPDDIVIKGNYAYIASYDDADLDIVDITDPASPVILSSTDLSAYGNTPENIAVSGNYLYMVMYGSDALNVIDISNPYAPTYVSTATTGDAPNGVIAQGRYVYVLSRNTDTLQVFDASNPATLRLVGSASTGNEPNRMVMNGNYIYVANYNAGGTGSITAIDVSDPTSPTAGDTENTASGEGGLALAVSDKYAYVTTDETSMYVFNISNPAAITQITSVFADADVEDLEIQGRYLYGVSNQGATSKLITYDISDPELPDALSSVTTGSDSYAMEVVGRYAYVTNYTSDTLQIFDIGGAYIQQLEAGGIKTSSVDTNELSVSSNAVVGGSFSVAGSTYIQGSLAVGGTANFSAITLSEGATRTIGVTTRSTNVAGSSLTISAGAAGTGASAFSGGTLTLQGGAAGGTGNAVGGSVTIAGGAGVGTGVQGLVNLSTSAFTSSATQSFAASGSLTSGLVDQYSTIPVNATATGLTVTIPAPHATNQIVGRLLYIAAVDNSNDFTISLAGTSITIVMKENSTATLIWNGTGWTAAGASSSTDLQSAYNNTIASAGGAELVLNAPGGSADGLTVRNNATTPITGGLLEVQTSIGSNLFTVNNNATEYATNGGAETAGASSSTFPSSTWDTTTGGTVDRYTTTGDNVATGQASVRVQTTTTNHGARNRISTSLTSGLTYTVSFAVRGASNFSTLEARYSPDGTTSGTVACATSQTVTSGIWTRVSCSFVASGTITSSNSILIRQTDSTARTFYLDNLSVNVNASATYAADGSVDAALGTNWTNFGTLDSLTRDTSVIYDTSGSVNVNTPNAADRGVRNNLAITPAPSTQYLVTFYARSSNTFNDIRVRYTRDGGTNFVSCVDYSTQTVSTTSFTEITCLFTTDSTTATDPDLIIDQPTGSDRNFYIDALSITLNTNNSNNVQIGGGNKGGPATLFTLDRSSSAPIAANNDAYLGSMYYDTTTGRIQCYEADGWGACGAAPDNIVNLNPEYAGAVLNGTGVGTMTADFCSDDTALTVNAALCGTGEAKNYYRWTSPQATQQTYSIYVTYQLPTTFNGFASDDTVQLVGRVDNTSNASVTYEMFKSTGSAVTQCGTGETNVITGGGGLADTWYSYGINGNESTGCSFNSSSAGNFIIFKINLKANSNANAYVSTLSFTTTGR